LEKDKSYGWRRRTGNVYRECSLRFLLRHYLLWLQSFD
jgi:hypothetical protein